jgi:hypothetical protein
VVLTAQGDAREKLAGTTQNDIVKEYLSRGTCIFAPGPSLRLTTDVIAWTVANCPKWNRARLPPQACRPAPHRTPHPGVGAALGSRRRRRCVGASVGRLNRDLTSDQIACARSVNAATTREAGATSSPSS